MDTHKVLIVEGGSDRKRLQKVLAEPVEIICTNGTVSPYRIDEMLMPYEDCDLFVFLDADESGEKIRTLFKRDYPEAIHLYTERVYRQVETTPYRVLAAILLSENFDVHPEFLL
ncbi:toprim domain-containing protein [Saccharococcus sp. Marseille-Q5394]|uniref:toprim domain-containing protein n=1 Tax=Saccharococcus sp. Marseille-Q5394 TaxID=2972778 RepID=UPI0021C57985|nr:toprim domain-containing protein [Saccharococcus sp. Marseille-Q5394]